MSIKELNAPVSENMKRIISESGIKQHVIAARMGCTPQELTDMVAGRRIIKISDIPRFCAVMGVDVGTLFYEKTSKAV